VWEATTGKRLRTFDVPIYQYYDPRPILSAIGKLALTYQHFSKSDGIEMLIWDVASRKKTSLSLGDPPSVYVYARPEGIRTQGRRTAPIHTRRPRLAVLRDLTGREDGRVHSQHR
jgi:hypothetical protein